MRVAIAFNEIFLSGLGTLHIAICIFAALLSLSSIIYCQIVFPIKTKKNRSKEGFLSCKASFVADVVSLFNHQETSDVPIIFLKRRQLLVCSLDFDLPLCSFAQVKEMG